MRFRDVLLGICLIKILVLWVYEVVAFAEKDVNVSCNTTSYVRML